MVITIKEVAITNMLFGGAKEIIRVPNEFHCKKEDTILCSIRLRTYKDNFEQWNHL